ncbi:MAG TPA: bifunctional shikimate kinase/3-dehydroquinate synthase [Candidatus Kapabacteria bacterium]|nr:bifunctional shikimate kinase/3-dehydroquinate synthase [Candidatus Kapabacteria bacterium]
MTWRNRNLYLLGLPGAGKTAIGSELATLLAEHLYTFIDLDKEIEREAGQTIAEIFAINGDDYFRALETRALLKVADANQHAIIATGGGIVLDPLNRSIIRGSGIPIWIDVNVREAAKNVWKDIQHGTDRPLFRELSEEQVVEKIRELLEARRPFYEQATLHFVTRTPRGNERTPKELAAELLIALDQMSLKVALKPRFKTLLAHSALGDYPILVGSGSGIRELIHTIEDRKIGHVVTTTDTNVAHQYGEEYRKTLLKHLGARCICDSIVIEAEETNKNDRTLFEILERLNALDIGRKNSLIVAFGGGVISDIAGFAASIYKRGIPIVFIPTTLLAQADAVIGGKTGIDLFGIKNLAGTFYPPSQVLIDPLYLRTLPRRELHAGLAEVLKYALIGSARMWQSLVKQLPRLIRGIDGAYESIIYESVLQKLRYVEVDEFERQHGVRELLNFGHTFGHALEAATGFTTLLHGEAVLLGMRAAAWLSSELGHLSTEQYIEIESVLKRIPLKIEIGASAENIFSMFKRDKKHNGANRVILLRSIGTAFVSEISDGEVCQTIDFLLSLV